MYLESVYVRFLMLYLRYIWSMQEILIMQRTMSSLGLAQFLILQRESVLFSTNSRALRISKELCFTSLGSWNFSTYHSFYESCNVYYQNDGEFLKASSFAFYNATNELCIIDNGFKTVRVQNNELWVWRNTAFTNYRIVFVRKGHIFS